MSCLHLVMNDSPQPHFPVEFGLMNTNSDLCHSIIISVDVSMTEERRRSRLARERAHIPEHVVDEIHLRPDHMH